MHLLGIERKKAGAGAGAGAGAESGEGAGAGAGAGLNSKPLHLRITREQSGNTMLFFMFPSFPVVHGIINIEGDQMYKITLRE